MALSYAIDFGTSNSLLAAASTEQIFNALPIDPGSYDPTVMRSLLYFPNQKKVLFGSNALKNYNDNPGEGRLIRSIKKHLPFRSFIGTWIEDRPMNLEDLIGLFLSELRKKGNQHFGEDIDRLVLGRPARFAEDDGDDRYAQSRLEIAARKAGFKEIEFVPEPIAAACEFRSTLQSEKIVLVADFGGGTSDFTVMKMKPGPYDPSDVLGIGGVARAGDALDGAVMRARVSRYFGSDIKFQIPMSSNWLTMPSHLVEKICSPADVSMLMKRDVMDFLKNIERWAKKAEDKEKMQRLFTLVEDQLGFPLFEKIEHAKRELSESGEGRILFDYPGINLNETVQRLEFEKYIQPSVDLILRALDETVKRSGLRCNEIDIVCCTGGTARVACLREAMELRFGKAKLQEHRVFHSVVQGLAHRAQEIFG
ncbi:MAG: Hsp70 family protein [Deltaproteobacteria bacterium]|nr:Hsp70 family protein [Deltaproteobacteria bacterium]